MSLQRAVRRTAAILPMPIRRRLRGLRALRAVPEIIRSWIAGTPSGGTVLVSYGRPDVPALSDRRTAYGGIVKLARLAKRYPNSPGRSNVLYLVSSRIPDGAVLLARATQRRGAVFVWNQNGVAYRGWYGPGWEEVNEPLAALLHTADHVFYQSQFCRLSADRFLGQRHGPWEILYNAVDTEAFTPSKRPPPGRPVLLLAGTQYQRYRLEHAIEVLERLVRGGIDATLLVTGHLWIDRNERSSAHAARAMAERAGVADRVTFHGPYSQREAPELFRSAHLLLHTKYNDPCPTVVVEALACGLPVVYSASGGVPELVGAEAGVGVPAPLDWEQDHPPDPARMAEGVSRALAQRDTLSAAARHRAVERFDLRPWIRRHEEVFGTLVRRYRARTVL